MRMHVVEEMDAFDIAKDGCCTAKRLGNEKKNKKLKSDCATTYTSAMHPLKKPKMPKPQSGDDRKDEKLKEKYKDHEEELEDLKHECDKMEQQICMLFEKFKAIGCKEVLQESMMNNIKNRSVHSFGDINKIAVQQYVSAILTWGTVTVPTFQIVIDKKVMLMIDFCTVTVNVN